MRHGRLVAAVLDRATADAGSRDGRGLRARAGRVMRTVRALPLRRCSRCSPCSPLLALLAPSFFAPRQPARRRDQQRDWSQIIAVGMTMVISDRADGHVGRRARRACARCCRRRWPREGRCRRCWRRPSRRWRADRLALLSGLLVARLRLPSIVVTLALLVILRDGLRWATDGAWVGGPARPIPVVRPGSKRRAGAAHRADAGGH